MCLILITDVISGKENGNLDYRGDTKNEVAKALDKEITYRRIYLYSNTTKIIYLYSLNVKIIVGAQCQMKMWGLVFKNEEFQDRNSTALNKA